MRPLACWDYGFEYRRAMGVCRVNVVRWHVEVSAWDRSLVQRNPTECGVSECEQEASIMWRPWPTKGCCAMTKRGKKTLSQRLFFYHKVHTTQSGVQGSY